MAEFSLFSNFVGAFEGAQAKKRQHALDIASLQANQTELRQNQQRLDIADRQERDHTELALAQQQLKGALEQLAERKETNTEKDTQSKITSRAGHSLTQKEVADSVAEHRRWEEAIGSAKLPGQLNVLQTMATKNSAQAKVTQGAIELAREHIKLLEQKYKLNKATAPYTVELAKMKVSDLKLRGDRIRQEMAIAAKKNDPDTLAQKALALKLHNEYLQGRIEMDRMKTSEFGPEEIAKFATKSAAATKAYNARHDKLDADYQEYEGWKAALGSVTDGQVFDPKSGNQVSVEVATSRLETAAKKVYDGQLESATLQSFAQGMAALTTEATNKAKAAGHIQSPTGGVLHPTAKPRRQPTPEHRLTPPHSGGTSTRDYINAALGR